MRAQRKSKSRDKLRAHRKQLRQQGLRPIEIWVPDVNSPVFTFLEDADRFQLVFSTGILDKG